MASKRYPASKVDPSPLAQPLKFEFSGLTAKNRFLKSSMTEQLSSWDAKVHEKRGIPSEKLINVYRTWGEGEYGLILSGNIMLFYDELEASGNAIIPLDASFSGERFDRFKAMATAAKAHGSLFVAQLSHPGRQVNDTINKHPISPSDVQLEGTVLGSTFAKPRPMVEKDFKTVIESFVHAAEFSYKAGFDGVELHAAHGYLLAQFLSPTTNKRTDQYGGSLTNRARIIFEIADAIRARITDHAFSIGIKVNSVEFQAEGFTPEDCTELCAELERRRFDYVELSGGTYQELAFDHRRESTKKREAFFLEFAEQIIKGLTKTKVYVTGGLRSAQAMVKALESIDGVGVARPATHEFDFPKKILSGEIESAIKPGIDDADFGLSNVAAGTQIRLVGNGKEPVDMSREDHRDSFLSTVKAWSEGMADNADGSKFGYPDLQGVKLQPYGTQYGKV